MSEHYTNHERPPETDLPVIWDGSEWRILGNQQRTSAVGSVFLPLSEKIKVLPRSEWKECDWTHIYDFITDQDGQGSCNPFAAVGALQHAIAYERGEKIELCPALVYGGINGGRDQGSMLGDAWDWLAKYGTVPTKFYSDAGRNPWLDWQSSKRPAGWAAEAKKFRFRENYECVSFDEICTAVQKAYFPDFGVDVGSNFTPDADGFIAVYRRDTRVRGHAMRAVGLKYFNNDWWLYVANSWARRWGRNGYCYMNSTYFRDQFTDGWAGRDAAMEDEP